ncbi:MAG: YtxH domain-containing protein [Acidobacteria bacterium]|nr:YtxH domain-containing protein [Acidobacteriota bacterium]
MARDESVGDGLLWFLLGAAVGATVALLYAPQSGKKTREYISKKTDESRETLTEAGREMYDRGRDLFEKGREIADEAAEIFERGRKLARG